MRKILSILAFLAVSAASALAADTVELPIGRHGTPVAVSIATGAYTNATPTNATAGVRLSNRTGVLIDNPSTNTASFHGHIGNCTSTAISTSTVKGPIEIAPSTNGGIIPLGMNECIWLVSRHTSAESVMIQDVSQRNGP